MSIGYHCLGNRCALAALFKDPVLVNLQLKSLAEDHLNQAVALDQATLGGLWTLNNYRQEWERPSSVLLGLCQGDGETEILLGMGCLWGIVDEAHITLLAVDPQFRRRGVGHTVLYGLLAIARQRHLSRATLEVQASNHIALILYEYFGFQIAGRRPDYYGVGDDALILWRGHLQTPPFEQALHRWHHSSQDRLLSAGWPNLEILL